MGEEVTKDAIVRSLTPTNRELKEHLNNTKLLYARALAADMPLDQAHQAWKTMQVWAEAFREEVGQWLEKEGPEWCTKRQIIMILIAEAAALHQELTTEER